MWSDLPHLETGSNDEAIPLARRSIHTDMLAWFNVLMCYSTGTCMMWFENRITNGPIVHMEAKRKDEMEIENSCELTKSW